MKLPITSQLLGNVPDLTFQSFWPKEGLDERITELLGDKNARSIALQLTAKTNWLALQKVVEYKATVLGDLLTDQLRVVSNEQVVKGSKELFGIFRRVDWSTFKSDPGQAIKLMVDAGIEAGLNALTSVPLAGELVGIVWGFGDRIVQLIEALTYQRPVYMPWATYSRSNDEELVQKIILELYAKSVDQTGLFRPPWEEVDAPWHLGSAGSENGVGRVVWAPWADGEIPWGNGVGLLPGTMRLFGQVQLEGQAEAGGVYPGLPADLPKLKRITASGAEMPWPPQVLNAGNYYPAASSTCGTMWNMAERHGSPDMYKIHVQTLLGEWKLAFEAMEESFLDLWEPGQPNLLLGTAQIPWMAYRVGPQDPWLLSPPWRVPSYASWVRPGLYQGEPPGAPGFITDSLWIEQDLPHNRQTRMVLNGRGTRVPGGLEFPGWPYGTAPAQHPCSRQGKCSSTLGAKATASGVSHPAAWKAVNGPAPKDYRKMPWPTPEMRQAEYASPWTAIVKPTLERLAAQQVACLKATIVCAYVRPVDLPGGLVKYGAFRDGEPLQQLCLDMREQLLKSPVRFRVNLADADAIDPQFAQLLRESGLTGTLADWPKSLGLAGGPIDGAPPPPAGQPPQGGLPFPRAPLGTRRSRGGGGGLVLAGLVGAAGLVGGGVAFARHQQSQRQKGRQHG